MKLKYNEARRLHEEAPSLSRAELRRLNKLYFGGEWLSSAAKKTMVDGFRKDLAKHIQAVYKETADIFKGPRDARSILEDLTKETTLLYVPSSAAQPPLKTVKKLTPMEELEKHSTLELRDGLLLAVKDMGNPHWDESEIVGNALSYVRAAKGGD